MKRLIVFFGFLSFSLIFSGCGETVQRDSGKTESLQAVSDSNFPQVMTGVWETGKNVGSSQKWGIKFEEDGTVKKIVHFLAGPVRLEEGGKLIEGQIENDYALFFLAPCEVKYDSTTQMLEVDVIVTDYHIQKPTFKLEGDCRSNFRGKISEDGKTWKVELRTFGRLEGAKNLSDEFIESNPDKVVFYKVDLSKKSGD